MRLAPRAGGSEWVVPQGQYFDRGSASVLPSWIPTGVRFNRIGGLHYI